MMHGQHGTSSALSVSGPISGPLSRSPGVFWSPKGFVKWRSRASQNSLVQVRSQKVRLLFSCFDLYWANLLLGLRFFLEVLISLNVNHHYNLETDCVNKLYRKPFWIQLSSAETICGHLPLPVLYGVCLSANLKNKAWNTRWKQH